MSEKLPKLSLRLHQNLAKVLVESEAKVKRIAEFSDDELAAHKKYLEAFYSVAKEADAYEDVDTDAA
jgi:hypothetical protein